MSKEYESVLVVARLQGDGEDSNFLYGRVTRVEARRMAIDELRERDYDPVIKYNTPIVINAVFASNDTIELIDEQERLQ